MVCLAVHTEAALLSSTQLLQLLVQDVHSLLHTLPLGHCHLAHTARGARANTQTLYRLMFKGSSESIGFVLRTTLHVRWDASLLKKKNIKHKTLRCI